MDQYQAVQKLTFNQSMPFFTLLTGLLVLVTFSSTVGAELYKWVDEQGKTHYSDRTPKINEHTVITPDTTSSQRAFDRSTEKTALILPYGKSSRKILLSQGFYQWNHSDHSKQKLGVYYLGRFCTSRGAIFADDLHTDHPRFLPGQHGIPKTIKGVLLNLGYDAHISELFDLQHRIQTLNGLYLKAELIELDLHTCAPVHSLIRTISPKKLAWNNFTKNRVSLSVRWQLFENMQQPALFETITHGYYDNWGNDRKAFSTINQALEIAVNNLFANQRLIDLITTEQAIAKTDKASPENEDKGWLQKLLPEMGNSIGQLLNNQHVMRARVAGVLSEASAIKVNSIEYYMTNGDWPLMVQDIRLSDRLFDTHKLISGIQFDHDGSFTFRLRESVFGPSRMLRMTPDTSSYENGSALGIDWDCSSNLSPEVLSEMCTAL